MQDWLSDVGFPGGKNGTFAVDVVEWRPYSGLPPPDWHFSWRLCLPTKFCVHRYISQVCRTSSAPDYDCRSIMSDAKGKKFFTPLVVIQDMRAQMKSHKKQVVSCLWNATCVSTCSYSSYNTLPSRTLYVSPCMCLSVIAIWTVPTGPARATYTSNWLLGW